MVRKTGCHAGVSNEGAVRRVLQFASFFTVSVEDKMPAGRVAGASEAAVRHICSLHCRVFAGLGALPRVDGARAALLGRDKRGGQRSNDEHEAKSPQNHRGCTSKSGIQDWRVFIVFVYWCAL